VIFFQGLDDNVVPPAQTEAMAEALRSQAVPVEVHLFAGEGHGFKSSDTQIQVLESTEAFFAKHFDLQQAT
jgi:dipeptidyl aminopeptidase/acylaminoacyl peptidase